MSSRIPRLVVRPHVPKRGTLAWSAALAGGALVLWGAFEAGRALGGYSVFTDLAGRHARALEVTTLTQQLREAQARIAEVEVAKRVDHEAYTQVEKSLAELQSRLGEQSQELTFYRGIVNPADGIAGMRIQRLQILPGIAPRRYRVRIVLIQAAPKDAVANASADFYVDGLRAGRPESLPLAEIGTAAKILAFSFRYFQEVETEIELPPDLLPHAVRVEVRPAKGATPLRATYPWKIDTT